MDPTIIRKKKICNGTNFAGPDVNSKICIVMGNIQCATAGYQMCQEFLVKICAGPLEMGSAGTNR